MVTDGDSFDHVQLPTVQQVVSLDEHQWLLKNGYSPRKPDNRSLSDDDSADEVEFPSQVKPTLEKGHPPTKSTRLQKSSYIIYLVALYSSFTVFAWVMLCILSYRPLGLKSYNVVYHENGLYDGSGTGTYFATNQRWYRSVRIIQAVLSVVTIPLTSAICSVAAVAFVQQSAKYKSLSLRQTMVLADKGWTDPRIWLQLLKAGGREKYGSALLLLALGLNLLGGLIAPIEQAFLGTKTIKTPTLARKMEPQFDILDHFPVRSDQAGNFDSNIIPILTRASLAQTSLSDVQSRLWTDSSTLCKDINAVSSTMRDYCITKSATLANMTELGHPFVAQLPPTVNTGLLRQFMPRINSTAHRSVISAEEYRRNCENGTSNFFAQYSGDGWSFTACMPNNTNVSPWKSTRERQDFSEQLYLNISYSYLQYNITGGRQLSKIVLNTTAGFFELPNYMNGGLPGPLITNDPTNFCGMDCAVQGSSSQSIRNKNLTARSDVRRSDNFSSPYNASKPTANFAATPNKGPLTAIAIALFGGGSFLQHRAEQPNAFITGTAGYYCIDLAPMQRLLSTLTNSGMQGNRASPVSYCVQDYSPTVNAINNQIQSYLASFTYNDNDLDHGSSARIENAFTAAAFLTNEAWLLNPEHIGSLLVSFDMGADSQIPIISKAGMIIVSFLLALYLLSILALSIYSARSPHWTETLDSFAMMRIGASISTELPLDIMYSPHRFGRLDQLPGWIGDGSGDQSDLGKLNLGGPTPLRPQRRYQSYELDPEPADTYF